MILSGFCWDFGTKANLELLTGREERNSLLWILRKSGAMNAMDALDAVDASFQAQTVATRALQNTGKALPQLCTVKLCDLVGFIRWHDCPILSLWRFCSHCGHPAATSDR